MRPGPTISMAQMCQLPSCSMYTLAPQLTAYAALGNTSPTFRSLFSSPSARALMPYASFTGTCLMATATLVGTCAHMWRIQRSRTNGHVTVCCVTCHHWNPSQCAAVCRPVLHCLHALLTCVLTTLMDDVTNQWHHKEAAAGGCTESLSCKDLSLHGMQSVHHGCTCALSM